jgi:capsule biosynthesis phosphatase
MNIIIPIGGIGKRFTDEGYSLPKPLIRSLGQSIIFRNIQSLNIRKEDIVYVVYRDELKSVNFESLLKNKFPKIIFKFISIKNDTRGASETVLYALDKMNNEELQKEIIVIDSDNIYNDNILDNVRNKKQNTIFFKKDQSINPIFSYIEIDENFKVISIKEKEKISDNACIGAYAFSSGVVLKKTIQSVIQENIKQKNEFYISNLYEFLIHKNVEVFSIEVESYHSLGTPNQLRSFSSSFDNSEKLRFCFDLDNTLVSYPKIEGDYTSVDPLQNTINFLNFLHSLGHTIIIYTARRMKTHKGNVGSVQKDIAKVTLETLENFGINYDEIYFGKPYAHFYIDDLSIRPSENLEKETGFYNIHPKTRDHNKIEIYDKHIIKYSSSIEGERFFYQNIPTEIKHLFPELLDSGKDYIKISRVNGIPMSFLNANNLLNEKLLTSLLNTIKSIHSLGVNDEPNIYANYSEKFIKRISEFNFSLYQNFDEISKDILSFLNNYEKNKEGIIGVIHGDPVLTNVLIDTNDTIKMIDMRGKLGEKLTIYGDIFYDYAKIYQSIIGYDRILMDKELDFEYIENVKKIFHNFIVKNFGERQLMNIKQITKSLLLSLIPLHNNEKCYFYFKLIENI